MCEYFVKADPILYEQRTRAIRIHGVPTSIRLENMVWDTLAEMAASEGCTTNSLIVRFHDEILVHRGEVPNFASFLRVTGMRFLRRRLIEATPGVLGSASAGPNAGTSAGTNAGPSAVPRTVANTPSRVVVPLAARS